MIPDGALSYLRSPSLRPLWTTAHARLVRNSRTVAGRIRLTDLDLEQRQALGHLLDRLVGPSCPVDLADLDRRLRATAVGTGLLDVVEAVVGPVPDRRTDDAAERERRAALRSGADAALTSAGLGDLPWAAEWLDRLWQQGLPARMSSSQAGLVVGQAVTVLGHTLGPHARTWSRGELAQTVTGTAHGLDDEAPLTRLVLRGLALALTGSAAVPSVAADRRSLWDAAGVTGDTVATTVLTCGLRPDNVPWLRDREETHFTLREVRRLAPWSLPPQTVYVCENPRVLEAALDRGIQAPIVCTMGNPTTVTLALLDALTACDGVTLAYHGDFDWPGIAIATRVMRRYPTVPWQFTAGDYRQAITRATAAGTPLQPLTGRPTETPWDPALAEAMHDHAVAIHEEALIDSLLTDLRA
ncbi:MAG TPA: TIGR02679 family protein [Actinoplanes sp.]|nr:TIGR02679 family protein [Actinoplanes sp.]